MIGRYEQVEVSEIWSEQNRFDPDGKCLRLAELSSKVVPSCYVQGKSAKPG